ncbi:TetR/AcrR family transcriptional regulator [Acuticoccus sp.]|uniref:TetR/AcrR family transcriptional regulator n=1 Tax=Acuticoccus sp. TaxID=1904378 RepID=UPI003B519F79
MAVGRPKTFDAEATLDAVVEILSREGVRATSLNEIAARTGASKPALARAFGGKEALTVRALERYLCTIEAPLREALAGDGSLEEVATRYLGAFAALHTRTNSAPGCLLATASSDCSALEDGPLRRTVEAALAENLAALRDRLARAGAQAPDDLARFLAGQTVAMSVMARNGATRGDLTRFAKLAVRAVRDEADL